jgi:isopropylmalate/homocitrate/citramalate synthase
MKKEMTVEEKLEIIRWSIENGAQIDMHFHNDLSLEEGQKIINHLTDLTGAKVRHSEHISVLGFEYSTGVKGLDAAVFYVKSKEDLKAELKKQLDELVKGEETTV